MAGSVQAPLTSIGSSSWSRSQLVAPDGTPTTETRYRRDSARDAGLALRADGRHPRHSTRSSSTCSDRVSSRCSRRAAARRPRRSGRRRACARPTGCSRSTARSARSCCAASRPRRWARSGGAAGTAGSGSPRSAVAPIAIPIGTHGLHAVGAAMAAQRLGEDSVTVAYLGDGATSEGDAHEALNLAAVFKAPCVFFVQNNQWAISVPVSRQQAGPSIAHRAHRLRDARHPRRRQRRAGVLRGDGRGRRTRARAGGGPTLIEAVTYRMGPHTTSDDPTRYRPQRRGRAVGRAGPDCTATAPTYRTSTCGPSGWSTASRRGRRGCAPNCATRSSTRPTWTSASCSTRSTPRSPRTWKPSATS